MIAGEGELRPALERQIKEHHLEKHVTAAGFRPDVLSLHKAFDIFVMSSVTEGLGTSLLDAMACGKPIVATTAGGIPEVVEDGETGLPRPAARSRRDGRRDRAAAEGRGPAAADGRGRAGQRAANGSAPSGWCRTRCGSTSASRCTRTRRHERRTLRVRNRGKPGAAPRAANRTLVERDRRAVVEKVTPRTAARVAAIGRAASPA